MFTRLSQKLYLRIWLAVVGMLVLVFIGSALGWRAYMEHERNEYLQNPPSLPSREVQIRDGDGKVVAKGVSKAGRRPGSGLEFDIVLPSGQEWNVYVPPRQRFASEASGDPRSTLRPGAAPPPPGVLDWRWLPKWVQPPYNFIWVLLIVSIAIAMGAYPVVRKLTRRLETLSEGVKHFGEGNLSTRVHIRGDDEVAHLGHQFNAAAQRVQQLVESQKSLLANASHELRSPLARIRMCMEMLSAGPTPSSSSALKVEVERNIQELDQLIEEILLSSRLDALRSGKSVDLGQPERVELIGLCAEECARVGAELQVSGAVQHCQVTGHPRLITRLVRNLLENAKRYSNGAIDLYLEIPKSADCVQLRVCDNGPGVPEDLRERIFEPFYRLPGASEREGGVGLGLALVKSIVLQHRGTVVCEDRPDGSRGACFTVTLPHV